MGTKHPDQIAPSHWRGAAETVAEMYQRRWEILAICRHCHLMMVVDLRIIAVIKGADFSLWNRHARCRRLHCPGFVDFEFKTPGMTRHKRLSAPDRGEVPPGGHVSRAFEEERQRQARDLSLSTPPEANS